MRSPKQAVLPRITAVISLAIHERRLIRRALRVLWETLSVSEFYAFPALSGMVSTYCKRPNTKVSQQQVGQSTHSYDVSEHSTDYSGIPLLYAITSERRTARALQTSRERGGTRDLKLFVAFLWPPLRASPSPLPLGFGLQWASRR